VKPQLGAGLAPFGIGRTRPHHFLENPLIATDRRDDVALVPDYNAVVEVRRA
jgi:hypothetical protein